MTTLFSITGMIVWLLLSGAAFMTAAVFLAKAIVTRREFGNVAYALASVFTENEDHIRQLRRICWRMKRNATATDVRTAWTKYINEQKKDEPDPDA